MSTSVKIAALVTDVYSDRKYEVARHLPADLHQCKIASDEEIAGLPDHVFGVVVKTGESLSRLFPCHDQEALKLSEAYLKLTGAKLPVEIREMAEAKLAAMAGCYAAGGPNQVDAKSPEYQNYLKVAFVDAIKIRPRVKVSHSETCWGLVIEGKNHFPLHDATLTKTAVSRYPFTADGLDASQRFQYARALVKRAEKLGVEIPDGSPINLYSNDEMNISALDSAIQDRIKIARSRDLGVAVLQELSNEAGILAPRGDAEDENSWLYRQAKLAAAPKLGAAEIVAVLQAFDKFAGITDVDYRNGVLDPFASCFKKAGYGNSFLIDGVDLSSLTVGDLSSNFDAGFVSNFMSNPVGVYRSLPDPTRAVIRQMAQKNGGGNPPAQRPARQSAGASGDPMVTLNPIYGNGVPNTTD